MFDEIWYYTQIYAVLFMLLLLLFIHVHKYHKV